ncbi:unnamed protein product [Rotaria socialis]|uniref:Uncharacterized protein n=3 Tax=Rotaria socialis TaxID=392032 RepID=A0A818M0T8_9BILA|nr:unnamed protein product [Rotaria socialis]
MLFGGPHESSSDEDFSETDTTATTSSSASYVTSKTTTTDSWHDVKSDTEQQSEIIKQLEQIKDTDVNGPTLDEEDKALIRSIDDRYFGGDSMETESITIIEHEAPSVTSDDDKEQHTTNESVNLRASANFELTTPVAGAIIQENTDSCNVRCLSSNTDKEQIPTNSILINDEPTHIQNQTVTTLTDTVANGADHFNYKRFDTLCHQNIRNEPILNQQSTSLRRDGTIPNDKSSSQPQNIGSETLLNSQPTPWINPYWNTKTTQNLTSIGDKFELTTSSIDTGENSLPQHHESELTVSNKPDESFFHSSSNKSELENVVHHEDEHRSLLSNDAKSNQPQTLTTGALEESSNNNSNSNNKNNALDITLLNNQQVEGCDRPAGNDNQTSLPEFSRRTTHPTSTLNPVNEQSKTAASSLARDSTLQDQSLKEKEADSLTSIQTTIRFTDNPSVNPVKTPNSICSKQEDKIFENPYWKDRRLDPIDYSTPEFAPKLITLSEDKISSAATQIETDNKPFENPYWKDKTLTVVPTTTLEVQKNDNPHITDTTSLVEPSTKQKVIAFENPSWEDENLHSNISNTQETPSTNVISVEEKNTATETSTKKERTSFDNPKWNDTKTDSILPTNPEVKSEVNLPTTVISTEFDPTPKAHDKPFENPYWNDNTPTQLPAATQEAPPKDNLSSRNTTPVTDASTKLQEKPFENPYWKDNKSVVLSSVTQEVPPKDNLSGRNATPVTDASVKLQEKPFENPYWKDNKTVVVPSVTPELQQTANFPGRNTTPVTDASTKLQEKSFENPYWKDNKSVVVPSVTQKVPPKANFLGRNTTPVTDASPNLQEKPFENPYWKDNKTVVVPSVTPELQQTANFPGRNTTSVTDASTKLQEKSFENPYWKDNKSVVVSSVTQEVPPKDNLPGRNTTPIADISGKVQEKSFKNPYWKEDKSVVVPSVTPEAQPKANLLAKNTSAVTDTSAKTLNKLFENPYWKDNKPVVVPSGTQEVPPPANFLVTNITPVTDASVKVLNKQFENPYWKDNKSVVAPSVTQKVQPKANLLAGNATGVTDTSGKVLDKPFESPYWKENKADLIKTGMTHNRRTEIIAREEKKPLHITCWALEDEVFEIVCPESEIDISLLSQVEAFDKPYWKNTKPVIVTLSKSQESAAENRRRENDEPTTVSDVRSEEKALKNSLWNEKETRDSLASKSVGRLFENNNWDQCAPQVRVTALSKPQTIPKEYSSVQDNKSQQMDSSKQDAESWQNPYWPSEPSKIRSGENSTSQVVTIGKVQDTKDAKQTDRAAEDPYSKATSKRKQNSKTIELLSAWVFDNTSPADHTVPPIPPFYKRVFPPETPPASVRSVVTITDKKLQTSKPSTQYSSSNVFYDSGSDMSTFTFDQEKIAHHHTLLPSTNVSKNTIDSFVPSSLTNKNPVLVNGKNDATVAHQMNTMSSDLLRNKTALLLPVDNTVPSTAATTSSNIEWFKFPPDSRMGHESSINDLTPEEILEVQNVLRLLETNPNAIPTIQKPYKVQNFHANNVEAPDLQFSNLSTNNNVNQLTQKLLPPSSTHIQNYR